MNVLSEINEQGCLQIEKIELTISKLPTACLDWLDTQIERSKEKEKIVLNWIQDYQFEYDRIGTSSCSITFGGFTPKIWALFHGKVTYMTVYGKVISFKDNKQYNLLWNIPCNLKVEDLDINQDSDRVTTTYVTLSGDMW